MKLCITTSEMSQLQYQLGEGKTRVRSFIVEIPDTSLPIGLQHFFTLREVGEDFKRYSNIDSITIVEE